MATYCIPQYRPDNGYHLAKPYCLITKEHDEFLSHIRGSNKGLYPHTHVFPGTMQVGNESGANASIYVSNPDRGNIIQLKRKYDDNGYYNIFRR